VVRQLSRWWRLLIDAIIEHETVAQAVVEGPDEDLGQCRLVLTRGHAWARLTGDYFCRPSDCYRM
jgi:hypothetical protein